MLLYTQEFDTSLWLISVGTVALLVVLIASVTLINGGKARDALQWSTFWIYGTLLDHTADHVIPETWRNSKILLPRLTALVLFLALVLNNHYRAELSVDYVAGNELLTSWTRLDQLLNFSALYIPMGSSMWTRVMDDDFLLDYKYRDLDKLHVLQVGSKLLFTCEKMLGGKSKGAEDEIPCMLYSHNVELEAEIATVSPQRAGILCKTRTRSAQNGFANLGIPTAKNLGRAWQGHEGGQETQV